MNGRIVARRAVFPLLAPSCLLAMTQGVSAGVDTRTVFDFSLRGQVAGSDLNSRFEVDNSGRVSGLNMSLRGGRYSGEAGDLAADWDELSFASRTFRGLRLGSALGRGQATLLGGSVEATNLAGQSESSTVFGIRGAYPITPGLELRAAQLWSAGAITDPVTSVGLQFKPDKQDTFALELARSRSGTGWQLGASHRDRHLDIQARYRQVSDGFSSAGNPLLLTERSGHAAQIVYRPQRSISLLAASKQYTNAFNEKDSVERAAIQFSKPGLPSVSLFWQHRNERQLPVSFFQDLDGGLLDDPDTSTGAWTRTETRSVGLQLNKNVGGTDVMLGLENLQLNREGTDVPSRNSQRISLGLVRSLDARTTVQLFHSRELAVDAGRASSDRGQFTQISVFRSLNRRGLAVRLGLQQQSGFYSELSGKSLAAQVGLILPVARNTAVELDWRSNLMGSGFMQSRGQDVLQIRFRQAFQVGRSKRSPKTRQQRQLLTKIGGRVFEDVNLNGKWDTGEQPVREVAVALNRGKGVAVDGQGRYQFADLQPRTYKVGVVVKTIPIQYTMLAAPEASVSTAAGKTFEADFPVVRTGRIAGTVYQDDNRNGQQDAGEADCPNIVVRVVNSEVIGISDEKGHFFLDSLPPGRCSVVPDPALTDASLEATGPVDVTVSPNAETGGVNLGLSIERKAVINSFKKSQD